MSAPTQPTLVERLAEIASRDEAKSLTVRADDLREALARITAFEAALATARAGNVAAWIAGRDAAANEADWRLMAAFSKSIRELTPPADLSGALDRARDDAWNAALEAMRKGLMIENGSGGDHTISALHREPKEIT